MVSLGGAHQGYTARYLCGNRSFRGIGGRIKGIRTWSHLGVSEGAGDRVLCQVMEPNTQT